MQKKTIAITGATGVLGKFFIKKYKNYKYDIFKGDIRNIKDVKSWIKKINTNKILHFASKVPTDYVRKNYKNAMKVNYVGTKNLVNTLLKTKKTFWLFFASTSHVYKSSNTSLKETDLLKPSSLYGKTKLKAENYLLKLKKKQNTKICIARIFSFTDKNQPLPFLIPSLFSQIKKKKRIIHLKNLNHERDFCHIDDLCKAINLLKSKNSSGIFNVGSGKRVNLFNIIKLINKKNKTIDYKKNIKKTALIANISKIKKIGFKPKYGINKIISDLHKK